jgi:hypothetical protein
MYKYHTKLAIQDIQTNSGPLNIVIYLTPGFY